MLEPKILVVEDEALVAEDIKRTLQDLGYAVLSTASSGEEAIKKVNECRPDLVLMDIVLQGGMDGVETAKQISSRFNIPFIYLTAYSDKTTLEKAKITEPFGYIIKPFKEKELKMAIDLAIFKHDAEKKLKESKEWFCTTLASISDAVIATDPEGCVEFMNPVAQSLTGWEIEKSQGKPIKDILNILNGKNGASHEDFTIQVSGAEAIKDYQAVLISRNKLKIPIEISISPIKEDNGSFVGNVIVLRDISEHKRAEEALKLSEEKYRTLIENIQDGVFIIQDARIQFANEAFARIAGYTVDEITEKDFQDLVAPEDLEMVTDRYRRRQTGYEVPKDYEFRMLHKDGKKIIINMNVGLINYRGRVASMGTVKDITERKRAEEALRESEKRYQTLAELSPVGVFHNDSHGLCIYVNDRLCEITGLTPEQLYGFAWSKAIHSEDRDRVLNEWNNARQKNIPFHSEFRFQRPDGITTWVIGQVVAETGDGGEILGYVGTVTDITERKRAEEALRFKEKHFRLLIENASDIITILNADGTISYVSPSIERVLGYQPEELIGKIAFELIHPDDMGNVMDVFNDTIQNPGITRSAELRYRHKDGSWHIIESVGKSILNDTGANELIINSRDITERKKAEEEIKNSLKEKEILLREIHHRVKNNMQIISSLLKLQSGYTDERKYHDIFKECQNRIASMALIHENLYQSVELTKIDLNDYIRDLLNSLFQSYDISKGTITLNIDAENVPLGIDLATPCGLIINELVSNSLKHAFPNGREGEIKVAFRQTNENTFELTVNDNGIGIPEDIDFRKTESLGLSLVTMLVEDQFEGEISLDRNRGTGFRIKFKGGN